MSGTGSGGNNGVFTDKYKYQCQGCGYDCGGDSLWAWHGR